MPSYDKPKLLRLIIAERVARNAVLDFYHQGIDIRQDIQRIENIMMDTARQVGSPDQVRRLLNIPMNTAERLTREEVELFDVQLNYRDATGHQAAGKHRTGISFPEWQKLQILRRKNARLATEETRARDQADAQFGIVPNLVKAVIGWGFSDPRLEA